MPKVDAADSTQIVRDGRRLMIRPLQMRDVCMERGFVDKLSLVSHCLRFLDLMRTPRVASLGEMSTFNSSTDFGFLAVHMIGSTEDPVGVGRLSVGADHKDCQFAVNVADGWRNNGLGTLLMRRLTEAARDRGIKTMHSSAASANEQMHRFAVHSKMHHQRDPEDARQMLYSIDLSGSEAPTPSGSFARKRR